MLYKTEVKPFCFFQEFVYCAIRHNLSKRNMIGCSSVCHLIMKGLKESFSISFNSATGLISVHFLIAFSQHVRDVSPVWSEIFFSFPLIIIFSIIENHYCNDPLLFLFFKSFPIEIEPI